MLLATFRFMSIFHLDFKLYTPADICQFVTGGLDALEEVLNDRFDVMFATGSIGMGRMVAQAAVQNLTPHVLELGGKSPTYVSKKTDLEVWFVAAALVLFPILGRGICTYALS